MVLSAGALLLMKRGMRTDCFPGAEWEYVSPESVGFEPDRLAEFTKWMGGHGVIIRHGKIAAWWGYYAHLLDVASACKPVYVHLVQAAVQEGLIQSIDEPVALHQPKLATYGEETNKTITWRQLMRQTACYGVEEAPGTAFNYSDYQIALMTDTLVDKVYHAGFCHADEKILNTYLAGPLQFQDNATFLPERSWPGRLRISVRDFARFGLLYLNQGRWKHKQIIPRKAVLEMVSSPLPADFPRTNQKEEPMLPLQRSLGAGVNLEAHLGSYSYTWWVNGETTSGDRLFPDLPEDLFMAQGHSGRAVLLVIPSRDLVACWMDAEFGGKHATRFSRQGYRLVEEAIQKLIAGIQPEK